MDEQVNGEVVMVPDAAPQLPARYQSEVQTGIERYYQLVHELDTARADLRNATLDNERLRVALAGAAERERAHVQCVIDEGKINQHKAEIEVSMLQDEIGALRRELAVAHRVAQDARVEAAELAAALSMIGANVIEVLNRRAPHEQERAAKQERLHA